jgi:hypothetical protein
MLELRQLKMQGWTTKVDSIGARLVSKKEFDGATAAQAPKAAVRARLACSILDRHNEGPDELTMVVADASGWSSQLEFAQVSTEAMRALGANESKLRIFIDGGYGQSAEILKGIRHIENQRFKKCDLGGKRFTSLRKSEQVSFGEGSATLFIPAS